MLLLDLTINIFNCQVGALGIIGGGALALVATSFAGQALLAPAGIGAIGKVPGQNKTPQKFLNFFRSSRSRWFCRVRYPDLYVSLLQKSLLLHGNKPALRTADGEGAGAVSF